jgi:aspartate/methionine/tyrosine aminotransferase
MNENAVALNAVLESCTAGALLSDFGKRMYFPRGIIAQSSEAKAKATMANATIGMATKDGKPFYLSAIDDAMPTLNAAETVAYAPTAGVEKLRESWRKKILHKNPLLEPEDISMPVVVPGITAGISYVADLFFWKGDVLISSAPCWDNYSLIFEERREAVMKGVSIFPKDLQAAKGLDLSEFRAAVEAEAKTGFVRLILNFPNNPTGYTPTRAEAKELFEIIETSAKAGAKVLAICDDAYYGLFYEEDIYPQSLFSRLASMHENVLAVKLDGPIKEDYVWGFRTAFVTFGNHSFKKEQFDALITKLQGAIRSSVSCSNTPSQYLALKVNDDSRTSGEKEHYGEILYNRYVALRKFTDKMAANTYLIPYPYNSGYFMSFKTACDAGVLRQKLLDEHGIGLVALGKDCLRLAFSSLEEDKIEEVCRVVYEQAEALCKA